MSILEKRKKLLGKQVKVICTDGLEYLNDNSFMERAANAVKGVADVIL